MLIQQKTQITQNKQVTKKVKKDMSFSKMIGSSNRLTLTYIVLFIWVALAVFAILMNGDLYALAVYFASGLPLILGYLWSETSRPTIKDAAEIVKGIGMRPGNNMGGYNSYGGNSYGNNSYGGYNTSYSGSYSSNNATDQITQNVNIDTTEQQIVSIYSDDASVELKVNQSQLSTLKNLGYVDMIGDKYTFKKNLIDQIKSLVNDNSQDPII